MPKHQYVAQPYKVTAEQFDPAAAPPQAGVCVCAGLAPHVHLVAECRVVVLTAGEWIYQDLFQPAYQVMADAEFRARFGGALAED